MPNLSSVLLLIKSYKNRHVDDELFYQSLTEIIATEVGCSRASLWLYSNIDLSEIVSIDLYDHNESRHSSGDKLTEVMFAPYIGAMRRDGAIDASDARQHPATRCFNDVYFLPNNIFSLLDIGIRLNGQLVGVFCCEQVNDYQRWTDAQKSYLMQVGKLITFALKPLLVHRFAELFDGL